MVAVKPAEIGAVLARTPRVPTILVFGPDAGLVGERVGKLVRLGVQDPDDPFQLVRLDGDLLALDPLRLVDEANTISLFGGKRVIVVRAGAKNIAPAVKPLLASPPSNACIIIHAGDLGRTAPLRTLCERSTQALAIPCYADGPRELNALIDDLLTTHGLSIEPDARMHLLGLLGADRQTTRNEIEKLALFARGAATITIVDVDSICGDAAAMMTDGLVDSTFAGQIRQLDDSSARLFADGNDPGVMVGYLLRHGLSLLATRSQIESGTSSSVAIEKMRLHFKRKDSVERQIRIWPSRDLLQVTGDLAKAVTNCRRISSRSSEIARVAMWSVAMRAARLQQRS